MISKYLDSSPPGEHAGVRPVELLRRELVLGLDGPLALFLSLRGFDPSLCQRHLLSGRQGDALFAGAFRFQVFQGLVLFLELLDEPRVDHIVPRAVRLSQVAVFDRVPGTVVVDLAEVVHVVHADLGVRHVPTLQESDRFWVVNHLFVAGFGCGVAVLFFGFFAV